MIFYEGVNMENNMTLIVDVRNVYGNEVIYPQNQVAKTFADLCGTKTLTRAAVQKIKELGYGVIAIKTVVNI
jgi:hypothetical protein